MDPFIDGPTCARDIPFLIDANVNVVRSYAVLPGQDHSACMEELAQAGIYVLMDLTGNLPGHKINITNPTWNYPLYDYMTSVVDTFHNYTNVLGFFVGTEVINSTETISAPFVKAAARDVKAYIKSKDYRAIPVGYAMADQSAIRQSQVAYLNCGADEDDAVDFLGLDSYVWCGNSTFTESGYSGFVSEWSNLSIPIFLSEYGCNQPSPRTFTEVTAIYSEKMTQVFSGGCVYQYFHDTADYGTLIAIKLCLQRLTVRRTCRCLRRQCEHEQRLFVFRQADGDHRSVWRQQQVLLPYEHSTGLSNHRQYLASGTDSATYAIQSTVQMHDAEFDLHIFAAAGRRIHR